MIVHILGGRREGETIQVADGTQFLVLAKEPVNLFAVLGGDLDEPIRTHAAVIETGQCGRHYIVVPEDW